MILIPLRYERAFCWLCVVDIVASVLLDMMIL